MNVEIGFVMDPIGSIKIHKDSTFAMALAAQSRGWTLHYMETGDLFLLDGQCWARTRELRVRDDPADWYQLGAVRARPLEELDVLMMRKDPPFDMEYVYATYLLERAELRGTLVVNRPQSLRDANEKVFTAWFAECCPPTLVTRHAEDIRVFLQEHGTIILKPLGSMGGASIFKVSAKDPNTNVIIETLTESGARFAMAQRFVPEIRLGDKRILLIDGEPVPYALARIPAKGETRGNLAAGARGEGVTLSDSDRRICARLGPELRRRGLLFVGLDVIGDYLTEVNVTSPTCIRELDAIYDLNIGGQVMDALQTRLEQATLQREADTAAGATEGRKLC